MASNLLDVCRFNPTLGGTTDWTYSSAVTGYQSPTAAGVVNSSVYSYRAESADLTQWEVGAGAYNTGTGVLARTTVLFNSSGTGTGAGQSGAGTKISFSTVPQVAIVALAEDLLPIASVGPFTNSLGADVSTNVSANYFSGPAVAQGSVGTFSVSGTVTVSDASAATTFYAKLWDGTTLIASGATTTGGAGFQDTISLSGSITAPAGNLRIDVRQPAATTGKISFNSTGNSKDSTITATRTK